MTRHHQQHQLPKKKRAREVSSNHSIHVIKVVCILVVVHMRREWKKGRKKEIEASDESSKIKTMRCVVNIPNEP